MLSGAFAVSLRFTNAYKRYFVSIWASFSFSNAGPTLETDFHKSLDLMSNVSLVSVQETEQH